MSTGESEIPDAGVRELFYRLLTAGSIEEFVDRLDVHGWGIPLALLGLAGFVRGVFEYLTDPFVVAEGYVFPGWGLALAINLVYGFFIVAFAWFMFFGLIGSFAGYFSESRDMDTAVLKLGTYVSVLFVPVFVVGSLIALTLSVPEGVAVVDDPDSVDAVTTVTTYFRDTLQMRVVRALKAAGWILAGFLLLPVIAHRYEIDHKRSVASVLPVTLAAVIATQLV